MAGRQCFHGTQQVQPGEAHDCWTTTEAALTRDLTEELRDAWARPARRPPNSASSGAPHRRGFTIVKLSAPTGGMLVTRRP